VLTGAELPKLFVSVTDTDVMPAGSALVVNGCV
jgi:hypothetical protein